MDYKTVTHCRACDSDKLSQYLDLGNLPLANGLTHNDSDESSRYPLQLLFCNNCALTQLSVVVDPKILYHKYPYRSSVSQTYKRHAYKLTGDLMEMYKKSHKCEDYFDMTEPTIVDIGANDGCLLHQAQRHGFRKLVAIEPDSSMNEAIGEGIIKMNNFFGPSIRGAVRLTFNSMSIGADFATATNVFAHMDSIKDFTENMTYILNPYGVAVIEVPYAVNMIEGCEFDTIYHEHLSYFTMKALYKLFQESNMGIFRVEKIGIHGGGLRLFLDFKVRSMEDSVWALMNEEFDNGYHYLYKYENFSLNVEMVKKGLLRKLHDLKARGKKVVGFGASAKGCTLLNYCGIDGLYLDHIIDETKEKQGRFVPGVNLEVKPYDYKDILETDAILLLAWNFQSEIKRKLVDFKGEWIMPLECV